MNIVSRDKGKSSPASKSSSFVCRAPRVELLQFEDCRMKEKTNPGVGEEVTMESRDLVLSCMAASRSACSWLGATLPRRQSTSTVILMPLEC